ncbi:MAG: lactate racemase domain-containing protein [Desulfobacterium sp.]
MDDMKSQFPRIVKVRQRISTAVLSDLSRALNQEMDQMPIPAMGLKGKRIGISVGSRGIDRCSQLLLSLCDRIKAWGGQPVIIPAMGSHGGGTEAGQLEVLEGLGITQKTMGAPIRACAQSTKLGETPEGYPLFCNRAALDMDHLILFNRIKKHTDFTGNIESGLHKIMTIGLGGPTGATHVHRLVLKEGYEKVIVSIARAMLEKLPVLFGVGVVENAVGHVNQIEVILPEALHSREAALLVQAKALDIKLPFHHANVLVVGEVGKDISGGGMEGSKVGRIRMIGQAEPTSPQIDRIVALSLTPATHGNATGLGLADITTRRVFDAVDLKKTALNCLISMGPEHAAIPCVTSSDREAIYWALGTVGLEDPAKTAKLAYIQNTKKLETLAVSEPLLKDFVDHGGIEVMSEPEPMQFDAKGNFLNFKYAVV